jgi:hypothetical protein
MIWGLVVFFSKYVSAAVPARAELRAGRRSRVEKE